MRDASATLWRALRSGNPIIAVLYEDAGLLEELVSEMESLLPIGSKVQRSSDVSASFQTPDAFLFLAPPDERQALLTLDGRRDALLDRRSPVVLLLLRGGEGVQSLSDVPGLSSWLQGNEIDPYRLQQIDPKHERESFEQQTGRSPEEWLVDYRAGRIPGTLENSLLATRAGLLENPP
ncbi:hypothetical protein [Hyalangium versicolor]|uniref:hypothetical protein n=1 Tax=Hyalangium versicolor TaxID=2861190 RepID=UPI001CCB58A3|nr:hypothetical protein [Hyalangium versicolor]